MKPSFAAVLKQVVREPYRAFFPLGILFGMAGVGHWLAYSLGWMEHYSGFLHSSIQILGYMSSFVFGFLLTAIPRFSAGEPATRIEFSTFLALLVAVYVFLALGVWPAAGAAHLLLLVSFLRFARRRFKRAVGKVTPPAEFVFIPLAMLHAVVGLVLVLAAQIFSLPVWVMGVGRPMLEQGFLLAIVMGVGGFMGPRLMGRGAVIPPRDPAALRNFYLRRIGVHLAAGALLFSSFWVEGLGFTRGGYILRALIVTSELFWTTRPWVLPRIGDLYVRLLWLSLWMVILGYVSSACALPLRKTFLHLTFLGGYSLMTFAVGTMVVLSHAGEAQRLRGPIGALTAVAVGVPAAMLLRLASSFLPRYYFPLLGASSAAWLFAAAAWLVFILPKVVTFPPEDVFEKIHEEARARLEGGAC